MVLTDLFSCHYSYILTLSYFRYTCTPGRFAHHCSDIVLLIEVFNNSNNNVIAQNHAQSEFIGERLGEYKWPMKEWKDELYGDDAEVTVMKKS